MNSRSRLRGPAGLYVGLLVLALAGLAAQLYATVWGGGVSPDSVQYIEGARSLLRGEGVSVPDGAGMPRPITLWPPLTSMVLAAPGLVGIDPAVTGRWFNGLLFAANIFLAGHMLARANRSAIAAWLGAALMLLSPDIFQIHTWIRSEPLFVLLSLAGCALLADYLQRPTSRGFWLAAIVAGLAWLNRWAGLALGLTGAGLILALGRFAAVRRRLAAAVGYGMVAVGPLMLWMLRNSQVAGSLTTRQWGYRRLYSVHFLPGLETASSWLFPAGPLSIPRATLLAVLLAGLAWSGVRYLRSPRSQTGALRFLPHCLATYAACFVAVVIFAKVFVDPTFRLDGRMLSAGLAALILLVVHLAHFELAGWWSIRPAAAMRWATRGAVVALIALQLGLSAWHSADWAMSAHRRGLGFNSRSWHESLLVDFVAGLPDRIVVFSNADDALLFSTGHLAWRLPETSALDNSPDPAWAEQIQQRAGGRPAYVVYFDAITWRDLLAPRDLEEHLSLETAFRTEEGVVLRLLPSTEE